MKRSVQHAFSLSGIQIPFGADTIENTQSIQSLSQTDYCGNFIYEDGQLSRILTPEGYIETTDSTGSTANTGNWRFSYFLKDHLGNVRARIACPEFSSPIPSSAPSSPPTSPPYTLLDTTDYYPFGMEISSPEGLLTSGNNPYLYNGKELDRMHGLNMYDYGARFYDPALARWWVIDPSAENYLSHSSYAYVLNNPMNLIDPDGRDTVEVFTKTGELFNHQKAKGDDVFIMVEKDDEGNINRLNKIAFLEGTLEAVRRPIVLSGDKRKQLTLFEIKGDKNAQDLFKFFARPENTQVEHTHAKIGSKSSGRNIVGTQNEGDKTGVGSYLLLTHYTLREVVHNHPDRSGPSGRPGGEKGDIPNAKKYDQRNPNTILKVYIHPDIDIYYNQYGITFPPIEKRPDE